MQLYNINKYTINNNVNCCTSAMLEWIMKAVNMKLLLLLLNIKCNTNIIIRLDLCSAITDAYLCNLIVDWNLLIKLIKYNTNI